MKTLSQLKENFDSNPGNPIGVTNHLTPIFNIITQVRNFFGSRLGIIVEPGEDNVSIKLHSSKFVNEREVNKVLDSYIGANGSNDITLRQFIINQGLTRVKMVSIGQFYVVYFSPDDIRIAQNPDAMACPEGDTCTVCTEQRQYRLGDCELDTIELTESMYTGEEELEDKSLEEIIAIINNADKIIGAQKIQDIVSKSISISDPYYFKAVKDEDGNESIALRCKTERRRPFGKTITVATSLLNIYKSGDQAVWVGAFDGEGCSEETRELIEQVLKAINAKPTDDECIWTISDVPAMDQINKSESNPEDTDDGGESDVEDTGNDLLDIMNPNSAEDQAE